MCQAGWSGGLLFRPVGKQKYVYTLKVVGGKLTGRAVGEFAGERHTNQIPEGRIEGKQVAFKLKGLPVSTRLFPVPSARAMKT